MVVLRVMRRMLLRGIGSSSVTTATTAAAVAEVLSGAIDPFVGRKCFDGDAAEERVAGDPTSHRVFDRRRHFSAAVKTLVRVGVSRRSVWIGVAGPPLRSILCEG